MHRVLASALLSLVTLVAAACGEDDPVSAGGGGSGVGAVGGTGAGAQGGEPAGGAGGEGGAPDGGAGPGPDDPACMGDGTTYYVSPDGDDASPGTQSAPLLTVARGLELAQPGDTVLLAAGAYRERVAFPRSGSEGHPIVLRGMAGAVIDGGDVVTGWQAAPEVGPNVYKNSTIGYDPWNMTWNGQYVLQIFRDVMSSQGFTILNEGPEGADSYGGTTYRSWDGIEVMFGSVEGVTYLRFADNLDPAAEDLTFAPRYGGVVHVDGQSHVSVCGLTLRNGFYGAFLENDAHHVVIHGNTIIGGHMGVEIRAGAHDNRVSHNELTLDYLHDLDPNDARHWFIWNVAKNTSTSDRVAVFLYHAGNDNVIESNHVYQHWDGVEDTAEDLPDEESVGYAQNLRVFGNVIEVCADDGLEPNGGEVNAEWHDNFVTDCNANLRIKDPVAGPIYIYRNRLWSESVDGPGSNTGIYFYRGTTATIYVYHNSISAHRNISFGAEPETGAPNTWYVNNVFSSDRFGTFDGDANDPHFDFNWAGGDVTAQPYMGEHNLLAPGERLWAVDDTAMLLEATSPAVERGIDLSEPWTVDGVPHAALPGMTPGYFDGAAPDLGAVQRTEP